MYIIILTYIKSNAISPVEIEYLVPASSYEEAVGMVQDRANVRVEIMGGTIVSIG